MSSVPLTQAVTSGDAGAVKALLATGADANERTGGGQTPLILATIFGHTHLIPLLLDAGADPQLRDKLGLNAIDWAQRRGATEAIDVLSKKPAITRTEIRPQTPPPAPTTPVQPSVEKPSSVSEEERSRRWIAGLKQRIAEQSQREVPDGPNIFRARPAPPPASEPQPAFEPDSQPQRASAERDAQLQRASESESEWRRAAAEREELLQFVTAEREPQPEIPAQPSKPEPEIPATPQEPKPEIPAPPPDPQPEMPTQPEPPTQVPESPSEPEPQTQAAISTVAPDPPRRPSGRKRCPKCNAIYNSDLVAYCAHHIVPLVDYDEQPIISEPQSTTTSPVLFWMIIIITLTGSIVVGSIFTAFFYGSKQVEPAITARQPGPNAVQKGVPAVDKELEGKAVSLPVAECPLNGQEAIPGTVVVNVTIDKTGQVKEAHATGGDWLLRGAATEAATKSTFAPEKLRGRDTEGTITYTFEP